MANKKKLPSAESYTSLGSSVQEFVCRGIQIKPGDKIPVRLGRPLRTPKEIAELAKGFTTSIQEFSSSAIVAKPAAAAKSAKAAKKPTRRKPKKNV